MSEERTKQLREVSGNIAYNDALTGFLYELIRDHLPAGKVEALVIRATQNPDAIFTNGWLAKYANNLAEELTNAKTNNLAKVLSEAFGGKIDYDVKEDRPSFKTDEQLLEERSQENKKIIDTLVQSGQIKPEEAEEMKKELEEFQKEAAIDATPTVYVGGGEPVKDGESVVITNNNPNLKFNDVK